MRLVELFASLPLPAPEAALPSFSTVAIFGGPHRLGKDARGAPAILLVASGLVGSRSLPVELEHVTLQHDVACLVSQAGGAQQEIFTLVRCRQLDRVLGEFFLGVIEGVLPIVGPAPSPVEVRAVIETLGELFRSLQMPARKTVQGLWAELLVLADAHDPATLASAWHADPQEPYDFSLGPQRLEVKSTSGPERRHYFRLEQLRASTGARVIVGSAIVERSGGGSSIADLLGRTKARLAGSPELLLRLDQIVAASLGEDWRKGLDQRFDLERARASMGFYRSEDIPSVDADLPSRVSDVRFRSDLSGVVPIGLAALREHGSLFEAALPSNAGGRI